MPAYQIKAAFRSHINVGGPAGGTELVNTFHLELDALSAVESWDNIANELMTALGTAYKNVLTDSMTWDDIVVQTEPTTDASTQVGVHQVNQAGTRAQTSATLPPEMCILVAAKSNTPKRYARGRMWLPPAMQGATTNLGLWDQSNAYWTMAGTFLEALADGFNVGDNTYAWVIYSRARHLRGESPNVFPVTTYQRRVAPFWLRSRASAP